MSEAQHLPIWAYVVDCSLHYAQDYRFAHRKSFPKSIDLDVLRLDISQEIDKRRAKTERDEDMPISRRMPGSICMTIWFIVLSSPLLPFCSDLYSQ